MKKILFLFFLLTLNFVFAQSLKNDFLNHFDDSRKINIINLDEKNRVDKKIFNSDKINLSFYTESNDIFIKNKLMFLDDQLFPDRSKVTVDDIKNELKKCHNIFLFSFSKYMDYKWKKN